MADIDLWEFILALDRSDVDVTKWESEFIENILQFRRTTYSPKQITVINKMIEKYEKRVNW